MTAEPITAPSPLAIAVAEAQAATAAAEADRTTPAAVPPVTTPLTALLALLVVLGLVACCYCARPVILPIILAAIVGMTLSPVIRWLARFHLTPAWSAALVLTLVVVGLAYGFTQLGRPALLWLNDAPRHMAELRQRVQTLFPRLQHVSQVADAVTNWGASVAEQEAAQRLAPTVAVQDGRAASSLLGWTWTVVVGAGETLVLAYLLLASGDLSLQKLVRVLPTLSDKKRAVAISHEIRHNLATYLRTVCLINVALGLLACAGLGLLGVPRPAMWGMLVALLNFLPYLGPVVGMGLLAVVGLLSFDTLWQALLPAGYYLLLHLLEANVVTPIFLGRRFTINPVVIFISLIFWGWLWGIPGALLSMPILVSIKVICDHLPRLAPLSELLAA